MADEPNKAAEAAGEAAKAVVQQTEAVEREAAGAVAAAQAEANAAAEEAKRIAAAALATDLGARIETTQKEFASWRTTAEQQAAQDREAIAALNNQVGELKTGLGLILGALKPANPSQSTPPQSEPPPKAPEAKNPAEGANGAGPPAAPPAPQHRRRLVL